MLHAQHATLWAKTSTPLLMQQHMHVILAPSLWSKSTFKLWSIKSCTGVKRDLAMTRPRKRAGACLDAAEQRDPVEQRLARGAHAAAQVDVRNAHTEAQPARHQRADAQRHRQVRQRVDLRATAPTLKPYTQTLKPSNLPGHGQHNVHRHVLHCTTKHLQQATLNRQPAWLVGAAGLPNNPGPGKRGFRCWCVQGATLCKAVASPGNGGLCQTAMS